MGTRSTTKAQYTAGPLCPFNYVLAVTTWLAFVVGCGGPDAREVRGALAKAAEAVEAHDGRRLFRAIDQRARHALAGIQASAAKAKKMIESDYPEAEQSAAIAALGDAVLAADAADLFVRRCPEACQRAIGAALGAPVSERVEGDETLVETTAGKQVRLYRGTDAHYGIVWNTEALMQERLERSRALDQIEKNAAIYRQRRALEE